MPKSSSEPILNITVEPKLHPCYLGHRLKRSTRFHPGPCLGLLMATPSGLLATIGPHSWHPDQRARVRMPWPTIKATYYCWTGLSRPIPGLTEIDYRRQSSIRQWRNDSMLLKNPCLYTEGTILAKQIVPRMNLTLRRLRFKSTKGEAPAPSQEMKRLCCTFRSPALPPSPTRGQSPKWSFPGNHTVLPRRRQILHLYV